MLIVVNDHWQEDEANDEAAQAIDAISQELAMRPMTEDFWNELPTQAKALFLEIMHDHVAGAILKAKKEGKERPFEISDRENPGI
jgi:cell fate (sporulation/competence/biofilm development) regulator YmcA (YheA/YmcA/DUF963 family)